MLLIYIVWLVINLVFFVISWEIGDFVARTRHYRRGKNFKITKGLFVISFLFFINLFLYWIL